MLVLASLSSARRVMLEAAGVPFVVQAANVDEGAIRAALLQRGDQARNIADALAEAKAIKVSGRRPGEIVLGADQLLVTADGAVLDKPGSRARAEEQLRLLRGSEHQLISAAVVAQDGRAVWRAVDSARLTMRAFSDEFLTDYLDREADAVLDLVGAYRLEGRGVQLFSRVVGDYSTILGVPLLPVLGFLRDRGIIGT